MRGGLREEPVLKLSLEECPESARQGCKVGAPRRVAALAKAGMCDRQAGLESDT